MSLGRPHRSTDELPSPDEPYLIRSVQRVCDILDLLQDSSEGVSLAGVARVTGLPRSSAFRYLTTLRYRRYIERVPNTEHFRLGSAFLPFRSRHLELFTEQARPHLERLRDRFQETINLGVLNGHRVIYLDIIESPKSMRLAARRGDRDQIHSTALGKAIAAHLPEEQVFAILAAEGMPKLTSRTINDPDEYMEELRAVRERGYALDDRENEEDGRCLAVPILGYRLPAAISLSAPHSRFPIDRAEEVAADLLTTERQLVAELTNEYT
jgi:IclR family transcriptional regulator, acetate operon repressor